MSILDIFSRERESVHISAERGLIIPGQEARKVVCYRCDRELGEDHDDERCARKQSTRRVFFGRMAATAVGAALIAKLEPNAMASNTPIAPEQIAAESGLFGKTPLDILTQAAKLYNEKQASPFAGFIVRRGDVLEVNQNIKRVTLGYQYEDVPQHPLMPRTAHRPHGYTETFFPKDGKIRIPHDMQIFTAYDAEEDIRVALTVLRPEEADAINGGVLIGAAKEKPLTDLESYIEKRKSEGVKFDDRWTLAGRDKLRERVGNYGTIGATPLALEAAEKELKKQQDKEYRRLLCGEDWHQFYYHPTRQRRLLIKPPLAKPLGYIPA